MINLQVERENVTLRMIHETMPMFATELRKALIYRVKDESDGLRMRRFFVAAGICAMRFRRRIRTACLG